MRMKTIRISIIVSLILVIAFAYWFQYYKLSNNATDGEKIENSEKAILTLWE